jgi:Subtilisin-like serine proteases
MKKRGLTILLSVVMILSTINLNIVAKSVVDNDILTIDEFNEDIISDELLPIEEYPIKEAEEIIEAPSIFEKDTSYDLGAQTFVTEAVDNSEYHLRKMFSIPDSVVIDRSKHIEEYLEIDLTPEELAIGKAASDESLVKDDIAKSPTANTSRITILNQTMTSVTFTYNFAANDRNRYMYFYDSHTNDWDWNISTWNDRGVPVNPPISGTITVNNLMPEGTYKIRMSYNNTGTWVYDYYEFTMPTDTSGTTVVEGTKMKMTIPVYLKNMLGATDATRYISALDTSYNHLANLVGAVPYNGDKVNIVPNKHEGAYIACSGNPIKFREAYLIEDFLYFKRPIGLSVYSNHELSHDFDSSRWNFDAEFFACFKSAYVYDMTKYSFIDHETLYTNGNMTLFFKQDQVYGGHDGMIATGVYHHYGLCYNMMKIKEVIGWEPFRQTFRFFNTLASNSIPTSNIDKLNLFLTKLRDFSPNNTDVIGMLTTQEKNIYKAKFGGNIAYYTVTVYSDDHANDIWNGTWLDINMPMDGIINYASDIDCFRFEAPTTGKYIVMSGGNTPLALQQLYELQPSGSAQGRSALFTDNASNFKRVYEFTAGKTYLIKTAHTSSTASSGTYNITVKYDDGSIDDHPNDIWTGTWMNFNTPMNGKINYAGDIDCFRFEAPTTGKYIVMSGGTTPLTLNQAYELLPSGSAQGKSALFTDSASNFKKVYEFTAGKTYMIKTSHTSSTASSGNYTMLVKADDGSIDDHSNTINTGTQITEGLPVDGKINYAGDIDCFEFIAPTTGKYTLISEKGTTLNCTLYLFNSSAGTYSSVAIISSFTYNNNIQNMYNLVQGATYWLSVRHSSTTAVSGNYAITISRDDHGDFYNNASDLTITNAKQSSNAKENKSSSKSSSNYGKNEFVINRFKDYDMFKFSVLYKQKYTVYTTGDIAVYGCLQQLNPSSGTYFTLDEEDSTVNGKNISFEYVLEPGKDYRLYVCKSFDKVYTAGYPSSKVEVFVDYYDDYPDDFNGTLITLPQNTTYNCDLGRNDVDCFKFTPVSDGVYKLTSTGSLDLKASLYDSDKTTKLYEIDDAPSTLNFILPYTLKANKTYYIKIEKSSKAALNKQVGDYSIKMEKFSTPNDTHFTNQWGLVNTGQNCNGVAGIAGLDINIVPAWEFSTGNGITVAVIDTGVQTAHEDLTNQFTLNINKAHNSSDVYPVNERQGGDLSAVEGHGTLVSGIIAANKGNGIGIAGVAPDATIMPIKMMGNPLNTNPVTVVNTNALSESIEYAVNNGANILNCSFEGGGINELTRLVNNSSDVLFVAAAGNHRLDLGINPVYPASIVADNLITIASSTANGELLVVSSDNGSNYGGNTHLAAPGVNIYTTFTNSNKYKYDRGTSLAAPFVSGVAALVWARNTDLSANQVKEILINNTRVRSNLNGLVSSGGILDAFYAICNNNYDISKGSNKTPSSAKEKSENEIKSMILDTMENASNVDKSKQIFINFKDLSEEKSFVKNLNNQFPKSKIVRKSTITNSLLVEFNTIKEAEEAIYQLNTKKSVNYAEMNYAVYLVE